MPKQNFENNELSGPGFIVQIDESMLHFKCKSHRGKAASNKTGALCIVEVKNGITRAYATVIFNEDMKKLLPNIISQVIPGSIIYTDKHKSYVALYSNRFNHNTVCHKYEFVDKTTGVQMLSVESYNNELKLMIKKEKGCQEFSRNNF